MKLRSTVKRAECIGNKIVSYPKGSRMEGKAIRRLDARRKDYTIMVNAMKKDAAGYKKPGRMK